MRLFYLQTSRLFHAHCEGLQAVYSHMHLHVNTSRGNCQNRGNCSVSNQAVTSGWHLTCNRDPWRTLTPVRSVEADLHRVILKSTSVLDVFEGCYFFVFSLSFSSLFLSLYDSLFFFLSMILSLSPSLSFPLSIFLSSLFPNIFSFALSPLLSSISISFYSYLSPSPFLPPSASNQGSNVSDPNPDKLYWGKKRKTPLTRMRIPLPRLLITGWSSGNILHFMTTVLM